MTAAEDEDDLNATDVDGDIVSTGATSDSAERPKGLPRLLRYAAMVIAHAEHIEQRLVAEIDEICPRLPQNASWALEFDPSVGLALADQLDHRAVTSNEPELHSVADCVRLLSLPVPRDTTYFEAHRRTSKALVLAFRQTAPSLEKKFRARLEGFVFAFAALAGCSYLLAANRGAADNAIHLASLMGTYQLDAAQAAVWKEVQKRDERRKKEDEVPAKSQSIEAERRKTPPTSDSTPSHSLVVARLSDDEMENTKLKDILAPLKSAINEALPLVEAPPLDQVRHALLFEFPYAAAVIDFALADLIGRTTIYFRPLLLVGDPGGGKSRFARRLGEELGVSVWRSDASQADGATFAGTSRRWHSAEPSHPFLAVVRGKIANPIVIIDELEKAATRSDYGRLWDSLLGFLEQETASRYPDPALQTNLNLSQVSYVATANSLDPLPQPLKDRFRVATFPKPTANDLDALLPAIIADLAKERGLDRIWMIALDEVERAVAAQLWHGGSVRRLRRVVEAIVRDRDARAARH